MANENARPDSSTDDQTAKNDEQNAEQTTDEKIKDRESREQTPTRSEKSLTAQERNEVAEHAKLSALSIYSVVHRQGEEELHRPATSLWWSGVAAGVGISTSVLAVAIIRSALGTEHPYLNLLQGFGYTFGFVFVILSRLQLFTENTITVVLPVLAEPSRDYYLQAARLWAIVLAANLVGTFLTALIAVHGGVFSDEILQAILQISHHVAELAPADALLRGIPSGFFIAALVWMSASAKSSELFVILMFTWLIAIGGFTHVIAGSNEIFTLVVHGDLNILIAFSHHILPVLAGNILGGTGLFALLAYGQVREEM